MPSHQGPPCSTNRKIRAKRRWLTKSDPTHYLSHNGCGYAFLYIYICIYLLYSAPIQHSQKLIQRPTKNLKMVIRQPASLCICTHIRQPLGRWTTRLRSIFSIPYPVSSVHSSLFGLSRDPLRLVPVLPGRSKLLLRRAPKPQERSKFPFGLSGALEITPRARCRTARAFEITGRT